MPRADLLVLSLDDLAALTNRGTAKRAERELEAGTPSCRIDETPEGELNVVWSDGITCRFPAGEPIHGAVCSSGVAGITRHVVRSVLAYQRHCGARDESTRGSEENVSADGPEEQSGGSPPQLAVSGPWDPGDFTDEDLVARFRKPAVNKARQRYEQGVLVELMRGEKPTARFLDDPCTVRFLVRGDLRYVTADCAEPLLATFVPMAVWAFRSLSADRMGGLVALQQADLPAPTDALNELELLLVELCCDGVAGCAATWPQRLARLEQKLREAGLTWPAELAIDLQNQHEMYRSRDARFEPLELVGLAGELLARSRAIARGTRTVPQLLIRGTRSDRVTEIAGGRLVGLGTGVRLGRRVITLSAYLQDADTGSLVAVERTFADPDPDSGEPPKCFSDLAETVITRGISMGSLGSSQLLLKSGKRTPGGHLILPRTAGSLTANPQAFTWEQLKPPAAVDNFSQLAARLSTLPPSYLRPRRVTENLHIVSVKGLANVGFDPAHQHLTAHLRDHEGGQALLEFPFHARGRQGFEALASELKQRGEQVSFVCGHVIPASRGLIVRPVSLVFAKGPRRIGLQPWIASSDTATDLAEGFAGSEPSAPLESFIHDVEFQLSELLITGVRRSDPGIARSWSGLVARAEQLGFVRLIEPLKRLAEPLEQKADVLRWDSLPAGKAALELCLFVRVACDGIG